MRSFTNRTGDKVEVTQEHLDNALAIYEELSKNSPSGKVSWRKLKKMMIEDGFENADSNESYRQLIKRERKEQGKLPSVEKHADMLADNKIKSIQEEIGEMRSSKREAQDQYLKLNRLKREIIRDNAVLKELVEAVESNPLPEMKDIRPMFSGEDDKKTLIVCLSDIHYGAVVREFGYSYSSKIAETVMQDYLQKVIRIAEDNLVETIHVIGLGDYIEHITMRNDNVYMAEMTWSEQVVGVSQLVSNFLIQLAKYFKVNYTAIAGNHDRVAGNKNDNIYGDSAITISNEIVKSTTQHVENITCVKTDEYHYLLEVNGFNFLFIHGDRTSIKPKDILGRMSVLYDKQVHALISGHVHHFTMRECGYQKHVVSFGSIKGSDSFSVKIGSTAQRSQGVIIVSEDDYEIRKVNL